MVNEKASGRAPEKMSGKAQLLVADDDQTIRRLLSYQAERAGFEVLSAADGNEAIALISERTEVVIVDLKMPGIDGFGCLEIISKDHPKIPVIVLTAANNADDAVAAMKLGAFDYITKPFDPDELVAVLLKAKRLHRAERENEDLRETINESGTVEMVATSPEMLTLIGQAKKIADLDSTVLITGESGVGKGVLARMIHSQGKRSSKPFVTISCPAVPRELLESELFGHEKGAFTGATKRRIGKIEAAQGGSIFLDEIGDLPLDLQPKLLNVLQDRQFQRVGGEETISVDVRVIAATNVDFEKKVADGSFRSDLFYRLSVIPFEIPPLRKRLDEIKALCEGLLSKIAKRQNSITRISSEAMKVMQRYDWPGNVRQLENILERAAAFCDEGVIQIADLPAEVLNSERTSSQLQQIGGISLAELEKEALLQTLDLCQGNKAETARRLGITEKSVYNKMKRHEL